MMDKAGNKAAAAEIAMIKVAAPRMALQRDRRRHPGAWRRGRDERLRPGAQPMPHIRTLRLADGPDEVHCRAIARLEMRKYTNARV